MPATNYGQAGQMNFMKETMNNIKCDILEGKQSVRGSVLETEIAVSKKQSEIIKCEVDLQNRVNKLEKFIDTNSLYSVAPLASQNIPQAQLYYDENINTPANENIPTAYKSINSVSSEEVQFVDSSSTVMSIENEQTTETGFKPNPPTYADAICVESLTMSFENEAHLGLSAVPRVAESSNIETGPQDNDFAPKETTTYPRERIPVLERGYTRVTPSNDDVELSTTKHTCHFCLLGFRRSMNRNILHSFISKGGYLANEIGPFQAPTVYTIRTFPMRRYRDRVVVRVNVAADFSADLLLNDRFWPSYMSCEPWKSRTFRQRSWEHSSTRARADHSCVSNRAQFNNHFTDRNPFGVLDCYSD
ncbi:uncharacterized protein LOC132717863 [Ruditapes philippinarum]|uniref:uncharacterized protein LOC132717863 n=1 Tax=Ruditapes philippinarum TaxID=129788 RepID=UPI00295B67F4|nr:uncharacterized protein LOC132717863 [Ruditapes philippinarum]